MWRPARPPVRGYGLLSGTDTAGLTVTITAGTGAAAGDIADITFANAYGAAPHVVLTADNSSAASLQYYRSSSTTGLSINVRIAPISSTTYTFDYPVQQ